FQVSSFKTGTFFTLLFLLWSMMYSALFLESGWVLIHVKYFMISLSESLILYRKLAKCSGFISAFVRYSTAFISASFSKLLSNEVEDKTLAVSLINSLPFVPVVIEIKVEKPISLINFFIT